MILFKKYRRTFFQRRRFSVSMGLFALLLGAMLVGNPAFANQKSEAAQNGPLMNDIPVVDAGALAEPPAANGEQTDSELDEDEACEIPDDYYASGSFWRALLDGPSALWPKFTLPSLYEASLIVQGQTQELIGKLMSSPQVLYFMPGFAGDIEESDGLEASALTNEPEDSDEDVLGPPSRGGIPIRLDPAWKPLIARLAKDGFNAAEMEAMFAKMGPESYTPAFMAAKIQELYGVPGIGVNRSKAPPPRLPRSFKRPIAEVTVGSCLSFIKRHAAQFAAIEKKHGVKAQAILGILLVETRLGRNLGKDSALRSLASMALTTTPDMLGSRGNAAQRARVSSASLANTLTVKSRWAYRELKALIRYAKQQSYEAYTIPGSIYGAIGICQFMPSNIKPYGIDGDGDGSVNLFSVVDAMYSVARYLEAHGWRSAGSEMGRHAVVRTYNMSWSYASMVLATANHLTRAASGKVSLAASPVVGGRRSIGGSAVAGVRGMRIDGRLRVPTSRLDPTLRRIRSIPKSARLKPLGSYNDLLR